MSRKKELLKYMFVICSSMILGIFVGAIYLKVRSLMPETYEFCSAVNTGEEVMYHIVAHNESIMMSSKGVPMR